MTSICSTGDSSAPDTDIGAFGWASPNPIQQPPNGL
jgi:hypothetical protein